MANKLYLKTCLWLFSKWNDLIARHTGICLFIIGCVILTAGLNMTVVAQQSSTTPAGSQSATGIIKDQLCKILELLEGPFGALITIVAGLAAVVAAAMGGYKLAMSCVVIACGSYIVGAFTDLFFDGATSKCAYSDGKRNF